MSKDGLLAELVARGTDAYREAMWPALTGEGSGAERLEAALTILCEVAEAQMAMLLALRSQSDRVFHREGEEEALTRSVFTDPLERILRDGIADGSLRPVDPLEAATVLFNLVGWTYIHMRTGHGWSPGAQHPGRARTSATRACRWELERVIPTTITGGREMITGIHAVIFTTDAEVDRAFFRDILELRSVDAGGGWPIFALPPAELAAHPADEDGQHELYLMCDDVHATVDELKRKGVESTGSDQRRGLGSADCDQAARRRRTRPLRAEAPDPEPVSADQLRHPRSGRDNPPPSRGCCSAGEERAPRSPVNPRPLRTSRDSPLRLPLAVALPILQASGPS